MRIRTYAFVHGGLPTVRMRVYVGARGCMCAGVHGDVSRIRARHIAMHMVLREHVSIRIRTAAHRCARAHAYATHRHALLRTYTRIRTVGNPPCTNAYEYAYPPMHIRMPYEHA